MHWTLDRSLLCSQAEYLVDALDTTEDQEKIMLIVNALADLGASGVTDDTIRGIRTACWEIYSELAQLEPPPGW